MVGENKRRKRAEKTVEEKKGMEPRAAGELDWKLRRPK
jgi:hypothetical protein